MQYGQISKDRNHYTRYQRKKIYFSSFPNLVLHGLDLESEHCIFENVGGTVTLIPLSGSQCSVNGIQIMEATHLNQGIWVSVFSVFVCSVPRKQVGSVHLRIIY